MKILHIKILISILVSPMILQATGVGIYIPYTLGNSASLTYDKAGEVDLDYDNTLGFGLAFDTNLGKNTLYNYRLGLEYLTPQVKGARNDFTRLNMVHTFGFGVLRTEKVRLWLGPRINLAYLYSSGSYGYERNAFEFGVAPAIGININVGPEVTLGFDVDYRFASVIGSYTNDFNDDTYIGSATGMTARFSLMYRFGEKFDTVNDIDPDL